MFETNEPNVPQISADDVNFAVDAKQNFILLDVRTEGEFSHGRIEGAIHLPVDDVATKITTTIPDKKATIYVYCLSGSRSVFAVDTMIKLGYTQVYNMTGGLLVWKSKDLPVEL